MLPPDPNAVPGDVPAVRPAPSDADGLQELAAFAARVLGAPVALVTELGAERQTFLANVGFGRDWTSIEESFCAHAVLHEGVFEVPDATQDARFRDNPLVTGAAHVRFYAGAPVRMGDGTPVNALCVLDTEPRTLTDFQRDTLALLARQVETRLALRARERELQAANAEAHRSAELMRMVSDRLPVRVAYIDREFRFRFVNDAYARDVGVTREAALGRTIAEVLGEGVFAVVRSFLERGLAGEDHAQEVEVPYPTGERAVQVTYVPDRDDRGRVRGVVVQAVDVTAQRAAATALRTSEAHYRTLFNSIDEGFCTFEMLFDEAGRPVDYRFLEVNDAFESQTGLSREAAVGRTIRELVPTHEQHWMDLYGRVALTGEPLRVEERAEGLGRWYEIHAFRIGGQGSREVGAIFKDVSMRQEAERALAAERERFDTVLRLSPTFVTILRDDELRFEYANPAYLRLVGGRSTVGLTLAEAQPEVVEGGALGQRFDAILREVMASGVPRTFTRVPVRFQPTPDAPIDDRILDFVYQPLADADGRVTGVFAQGMDVTEQARTEAERARLVAELAAARGRLDAVLGAAEIGVWDYDPGTGSIGADANLATMFGLDPEVARGAPAETFIARIHPDDRAKVAEAFGRAATEGTPYDVAYRTVVGDRPRYVVARGFAERDAEGRVVRMPGAVLDLTSVRLAEERERAAQETFRTVFEQAPDDAILVMDRDRTLTAWNPAAERIMGWTAAEAIGQPADIIFSPEDRALGAPEKEIEVAAREGKAEDERWHLRKDGTRFWGSGTMNALHDAEGNVTGFLKVFRDATDRYVETRVLAFLARLTDALIQRRDDDRLIPDAARMLGEFLAASRVLFAEANADGTQVTVRDEWSLGLPSLVGVHTIADYGPAVAEGFHAGRVHVSRDTERDYAPGAGLEAIRATGARANLAVPVLRDGRFAALLVVHCGEPRDWTEAEIALVRQAADRLTTEVERARAEEALREANQGLESRVEVRTAELAEAVQQAEGFNYSISHDLRTPLRAMVSTASILLEELGPDLGEAHRALLERQAHNANRMGRLIDELLRLSRFARVPVNRERLDMTAKVRSVFDELADQGRTNGCLLDAQEGMAAQGDRDLVRTVFHNLIGNACKFSPDGGTIRVRQEGGVFSVSDEGVGFDMAFAAKVFIPFERLVAEAEFEGTGIGLANVKRIVERHGGRVWVESEPGKGTTFFFTLE